MVFHTRQFPRAFRSRKTLYRGTCVRRLAGPVHPTAINDEYRARLSSIVESSNDAIISKDLNGTIRTWNQAATRLFGYAECECVGQSIMMLIPPARKYEEEMILARVRRGEKVDHYETVRRRKDGRLIDVSISVSPMRDSASRIIGASKIVRDITDRKLADATLRESEMRIRAIVDSAVDAIITIDEQGRIESVNPATERLFGFGASELIGRNVRMLMPEPFHSEHDGYIRSYLLTGNARIIGVTREVTGKRKDETTFPMSLAVNVVPIEGRRLFTGIVHDLTNRRELERQILEVGASEQRRIGQDLHDGLCQDLVGIAFQADAAARKLTADGVNDVSAIEGVAASVRAAAGQARELSHGLNPVDLHAGGLPSALQALATKITESFGVLCRFEWDGCTSVSDGLTATNLYRIAQEGISNAVKHGRAKQVLITLAESENHVVLSLADDGIGWKAGSKIDGIGLKGMQYRTNLMGGVLEIKTGRGSGTTITCSLRPAITRASRRPPPRTDSSVKP